MVTEQEIKSAIEQMIDNRVDGNRRLVRVPSKDNVEAILVLVAQISVLQDLLDWMEGKRNEIPPKLKAYRTAEEMVKEEGTKKVGDEK